MRAARVKKLVELGSIQPHDEGMNDAVFTASVEFCRAIDQSWQMKTEQRYWDIKTFLLKCHNSSKERFL